MIGRRYISISREGWYYLFLLTFVIGGAAFRQINLLVLLAGLMLGPLVFNWRYVAASLKRINVRRRLPRRICAGDPLIVEVIASNMSQWLGCHAMLVKDSIQLEGAPLRAYGTSVEAMIPYVAAGDSDQTTYRFSR